MNQEKVKRGQRCVVTSDDSGVQISFDKVNSAMLKELSKKQRKTPQKYLEDLISYYYQYE